MTEDRLGELINIRLDRKTYDLIKKDSGNEGVSYFIRECIREKLEKSYSKEQDEFIKEEIVELENKIKSLRLKLKENAAKREKFKAVKEQLLKEITKIPQIKQRLDILRQPDGMRFISKNLVIINDIIKKEGLDQLTEDELKILVKM